MAGGNWNWYDQWRAGMNPYLDAELIPHSHRIVTTWWETADNRIRLIDPGQPRATWEVTIGGPDLYSVVVKHDHRGWESARIENFSASLSRDVGWYAVDYGQVETFGTGRDELDVRWDWVDMRETARILGLDVAVASDVAFVEERWPVEYLEYPGRPPTLGSSGSLSTSASVNPDGSTRTSFRWDNPRENIQLGFPEKPSPLGRELLMSLLSPKQQAQLKRDGSFEVTAPSGNVYLLQASRNYNVSRVLHDGGRVSLCAVLQEPSRYGYGRQLPLYDQLAAQLLMIETDEQKFLSIANKMAGSPPPWPFLGTALGE